MSTVYEIVTNKIIDELEKGTIPWLKPWVSGGYPKNVITKKEYRGINVFLLASQKYASPYWLTFKQAQHLGGHVKKGEKATLVVFWKILQKRERAGEVHERNIPLLRYYNVFNSEQCEELDIEKIPVNDDFEPIPACEKTIQNMPNKPAIQHKENQAYYSPVLDCVNMPQAKYFEKEEEYYSTLFHELGHSTGHKSRLDRSTIMEANHFGSEAYSKEELIAEMTSAFLCGYHHIERETLKNSAACINGWLKKLRGDSKLVVLAASAAQKASDYILGKKGEECYE